MHIRNSVQGSPADLFRSALLCCLLSLNVLTSANCPKFCLHRAELEETLDRLQRIVSAIDADAEMAPPNTVERAFKPADSPASSGQPSPKLADALSSGKIVTRRRIASHLRPVPYRLH